MPPRRIILFAIGLLFLIVACLSLGFGYYLLSPADSQGLDQVFSVREGATLNQVADDLEKRGLITSRSLLMLWARFMGYGRDIKAGEYRLHPGMPPVKILKTLIRGVSLTYPVTIPEGFTVSQIAELLHAMGLADKDEFLLCARNADFLQDHGIKGSGIEGYLYPDTYYFGRGISARSIIEVMLKRFREMVEPLGERAKALGMSMEDVVILASIVEKETGRPQERAVIAGVFLNRLKRGMRLESDPTVIYDIQDFNGNLTRKNLNEPTPYNTYVIKGLPPGPIANPGIEAIRAVVYPEETEYLYFVSKNDGSHHFSRTFSEHCRAVRTYQKKNISRPKKIS
jgi:UPF0755 protein